MLLNFTDVENVCDLTQCDFIKKLCKGLPKEIRGIYRSTPALKNLFKVNQNTDIISKER